MQRRLWLAAALAIATGCTDGSTTKQALGQGGTLELVREKSFSELLPSGRYEASGVTFHDDSLRIVFDNRTQVAFVDTALGSATLGPGDKSKSQFEGITIAPGPETKMYVVEEIGAGDRGAIVTLDEAGLSLKTEPTDIVFSGSDKGLEGIAWLERHERLLVLCEERSCGAVDQRSGGGGVIKALRHEGDAWVTDATIALPMSATFDDYADLAVMPEDDGSYRVAVLSQESAALWIGTLGMSPPAIGESGTVYDFPRDGGRVAYCSLEGVTFVDRDTFALVSDRAKDADGCTKAEAVHLFRLP